MTDAVTWMRNDHGQTLDEALAIAGHRRTLVFAVWTAAWCPPCNELQLMVFDDPLFADVASRLVPIRIDGDVAGAQLVGERLGVRSYPTALLLDPEGRERLRLPGGLTPREYARALELGIEQQAPMSALVGRVLQGEQPSADECERLAFHWWQVDDRHAAGTDRLVLLRRVLAACPHERADARLRLIVQIIVAASARDVVLAPEEATELGVSLQQALAAPAARYSNLYLLIVDVSMLRVLSDSVRPLVEAALAHAVEALVAEHPLAPTERLIALSALMALALRRTGIVDDAMRERIRLAASRADAESVSIAQRQTAINMAGHLLKAAGHVEQSLALFEQEARRSPHGGYFWPYIARAHFEAGRIQDGLAAMRQAWQATPPGCARRVRGGAYVASLAEKSPAQRELVEREALAVLRELASAPDALAGQHRRAIGDLLKALGTTAD